MISGLASNTKYAFKVSAKNDCQTGPWSNTLSATTASSANKPPVKRSIVDNRPPLTSQENPTDMQDNNHDLFVFVKRGGLAIEGAEVNIENLRLKAYTDQEGRAVFTNLPSGSNNLNIRYGDLSSSQNFSISENDKNTIVNIDLAVKINFANNRIQLLIAFISLLFASHFLVLLKTIRVSLVNQKMMSKVSLSRYNY